MDTKTGKIYTQEQLDALTNLIPDERIRDFQARLVEVSSVVAEKMRLGNKAYKRKLKRERVKTLKRKQGKR